MYGKRKFCCDVSGYDQKKGKIETLKNILICSSSMLEFGVYTIMFQGHTREWIMNLIEQLQATVNFKSLVKIVWSLGVSWNLKYLKYLNSKEKEKYFSFTLLNLWSFYEITTFEKQNSETLCSEVIQIHFKPSYSGLKWKLKQEKIKKKTVCLQTNQNSVCLLFIVSDSWHLTL